MSTKPVFLPSSLTHAAQPKFAIPSDWKTTACMLAGDSFALAMVAVLAVLFRRLTHMPHSANAGIELLPCLLIVMVTFWAQGLYPGVLRHPVEEMRRIYTCITLVLLTIASTTFLWRSVAFYSTLALAWLIMPPLVLLTRYSLRLWFADKPWWGVTAVVLGSGPTAERVIRSLEDGTRGIKVTSIVPSENILAWSNDIPTAIGDMWTTLELQTHTAQYAIVAMPEHLAVELRHAIQCFCRGFSHVILVPDMPSLCSLGLSNVDFGSAFGVAMPQRLTHRGAQATKRLMDLLLASLALVFGAPLFLAIALVIKMTSRGPVFYKHVRIGRNGQNIQTLKFRTMVLNADSVLEAYLAANPAAHLEWMRDHKLKNDPRVIPGGKWLRRYSLDELPQLWNVLMGQMSLVGPRPIVEAEIERYGEGYEFYRRVRPGITGLWQVSGRNNTTYAERVAFDEYYVRNWSGWLDAYLLICTIKAVLTAHGAY